MLKKKRVIARLILPIVIGLAGSVELDAQQSVRYEDTPMRGGSITTIDAPITTEFGTYVPYRLPKYTPAIGKSAGTLRSDLENVSPPEGGFSWDYFTGKERGTFVSDQLVIRNEPVGTFAEIYNGSNDRPDFVPFITVDAAMHGLRATTADIYAEVVRQRLAPELEVLLFELSGNVGSAITTERSDDIREGLGRLLAWIETGRILLEPSVEADARVDKLVADALEKIAAGRSASSPILDRTLDYSRIRLQRRSSTSEIDRYRAAKLWLSEAGPRIAGSEEEAMVAALMARMVDALDARSRERLHDIIAVESFFSGRNSADMSLEAIAGGMRSWYGFQYDGGYGYLDGSGGVGKLRSYLAKYRNPSVGRGMQTGLLPRAHNFADALLNRAGSPEKLIAATATPRGKGGALGMALRSVAAEEWVASNEGVALYTASILAETVAGGSALPPFMRSDLWEKRRTESALGSFVSFLTPQGDVGVGSSSPRSVATTAGRSGGEMVAYVEPDPAAWAAVASWARYLGDGLATGPRGRMVGSELLKRVKDIENSGAHLMMIAAAELSGTPLTREQENFLASLPARIAAWENPAEKNGSVRLVAGSSGRSGMAVGHPRVLYVLVPDGAGLFRIARGGVLDYRTSTTPQEGYIAGLTASSGDLSRGIVSAEEINGIDARITEPTTSVATSGARSASTVRLDLESTVARRTEGALWFTLHAEGYDRVDVVATVVDQGGRVAYRSRPMQVENGKRLDMVPTDELQTGTYFIRVSDQIGRTLASGRFMVVR